MFVSHSQMMQTDFIAWVHAWTVTFLFCFIPLFSVSKGRAAEQEEGDSATPSPPSSSSSTTSSLTRRTCWRAPNNWVRTKQYVCPSQHSALPGLPGRRCLITLLFLISSFVACLKCIQCPLFRWRSHCVWDGGNLSGSERRKAAFVPCEVVGDALTLGVQSFILPSPGTECWLRHREWIEDWQRAKYNGCASWANQDSCRLDRALAVSLVSVYSLPWRDLLLPFIRPDLCESLCPSL